MRRTATSCPRAAASAVASARTCSMGERRRRWIALRTGPNLTPEASSATRPTAASCQTIHPQGERVLQPSAAPVSEPAAWYPWWNSSTTTRR